MVFGLALDGELDNERSSLSSMQPRSVGTKEELGYLCPTLVVGKPCVISDGWKVCGKVMPFGKLVCAQKPEGMSCVISSTVKVIPPVKWRGRGESSSVQCPCE